MIRQTNDNKNIVTMHVSINITCKFLKKTYKAKIIYLKYVKSNYFFSKISKKKF